MRYLFTELTAEEFGCFAENHSHASIQQTLAWARTKKDWSHVFLGLKDEQGTVAAATVMLTRKPLPLMGFGYCPRGPLCDFTDNEKLSVLTDGLKEYAKKHGLRYIKIDPAIPVNLTPVDYKPENCADLYPCVEEYKMSFENLTAAGWRHQGFPLGLGDCIQPRFNTVVPLKNADGSFFSPDEIKKHWRPSIRKYLGSFAQNRGIFYENLPVTDEILDEFTALIHQTELRQGIYLRGKDYFKRLTGYFGDDARILIGKCRVPVYLEYLRSRLGTEGDNREKTEEAIAECEKVLAERGEVVPLVGMLVVFPPNKNSVRIAEYLYTGADLGIFSAFHITTSCLYDAMLYCVERNCDGINLGGVEGDLQDGLYEFKSKFCPLLAEYYGEFDLVISESGYKFIKNGLPKMVRAYKKVTRFLKGDKRDK